MVGDCSLAELERNLYLGASEVACVMGCSPFGDALKVYMTKVYPQRESIPTERMQVGLDTEDFVLTQFEKKLGVTVTNKQYRMTHWQEVWAGATLDGMAVIDGKTAVVEAKTISTPLYLEAPLYYVMQVLWQQWISGAEKGYLAVWSTKDMLFRYYPIDVADHRELLEECIAKCKSFWFNHVVPQNPPEKRVVERSEQDLPDDLLDQYCSIQEQIKDLDAQKKELHQRIIESVGSPSELRAKNSRFQMDLTTQVSRRLNTKKLEHDNPELTQQYYEQNSSQRLVIKRLGVKF